MSTLTLKEGWNDLAIFAPLTKDKLIEEIGDDNLLIIQGAKQHSAYRELFSTQDRDFLNSFEKITVGQAYSVKVAHEVEISYTKVDGTDQEIELRKGWNHIAPLSTLSLAEIESQLGVGNLLIIQGSTAQSSFQRGLQNSFEAFQPNQAYWIKIDDDATLSFAN